MDTVEYSNSPEFVGELRNAHDTGKTIEVIGADYRSLHNCIRRNDLRLFITQDRHRSTLVVYKPKNRPEFAYRRKP